MENGSNLKTPLWNTLLTGNKVEGSNIKSYQRIQIITLFVVCELLAGGCNPGKKEYSDLFLTVFAPQKEGTFRGVHLQDDISITKRLENIGTPSYEDPLGVVYTQSLSENEELIIEYYTPMVSNGIETNQITAIVANIILQNEMQTDQLYKEIESYLSGKYGFPTGKYGNYIWEGVIQETSNTGMEIILKIDGSKNKITINFIDQQLN